MLSAAKSGQIPALSRNGEAPLGDEPGRLPQRLESSPRMKGGSCASWRKSSFVLQAMTEDDHHKQQRHGSDRHGDRPRAQSALRIARNAAHNRRRQRAGLGDLRAGDLAAPLPLRRAWRWDWGRGHRMDARLAPRLRRRPHRGDRQLHAQADRRWRAPAWQRLLLRAGALERDHGRGRWDHDRRQGCVQGGRDAELWLRDRGRRCRDRCCRRRSCG